jgi:lipoprotein-releasing system ATP-binding protein
VLADEPTGSLDTAASRHVWRLLSDLRSRRGTTVIVASHDITLAEHADRTLHLVDGRLAEDQDPRFEPAPGQVA